MTLVEFLLARIAEDEAACDGIYSGSGGPDFEWGPDRIRAECTAKRDVINFLLHHDTGSTWYVLVLMARPYADHADFDSWSSE